MSLFYQRIAIQKNSEKMITYAQVAGLKEGAMPLFYELLETKELNEFVVKYFYNVKEEAHNEKEFSTFLFQPEIKAKAFDFSNIFFQKLKSMRWMNPNVTTITVSRKHLLQYVESDPLVNFLSTLCDQIFIYNASAQYKNTFCYAIYCYRKRGEKF